MHSNVNLDAQLGVLVFVGTTLLLFAVTALFLFALIRGNRRLARVLTAVLVSVISGYLALIAAFSLVSRDEVLSRGEEKHFCELDCHIAYSITDVARVKSLTTSDRELMASGLFYVVNLKTRFDETTISPTRGNSLLYPNGRNVTVIDENGNRYAPVTGIHYSSPGFISRHVPITTALRPAESYLSVIVFDLPVDVKSPTLLINESAWPTHLIIGHENSLWHSKTRLQL